ncbi:MAG: hypothetical protein M3254_10185, partial [Actinomycetota bacterium]|nr:hypothetical protein [Actinomycetota bacterium]
LMSLTSLAFGVADTAWVLVLTRFVGGFGSALSWVAAFTWLTARVPDERRQRRVEDRVHEDYRTAEGQKSAHGSYCELPRRKRPGFLLR